MSDSTLNRFVGRGTTAQRTAFVPAPPTPSSGPSPGYVWWDSDLQAEYSYDFGLAAWVKIGGTNTNTRALAIVIDGAGSAIGTGVKADLYVPFAGTITAVTLLADQSGSVVVDIWKDTYGNYPPTVADTITAAAKPTIAAALKAQDTTLTGWTTSIVAGNTLRFNVDSAATITRLVLTLTVTV